MAKKDDSGGLVDFSGLDPVVNAALDLGQARQAARHKTPSQRKKAEKDRARNRRMFDIPADLEKTLEETAARLGCPVSNLAVYLLDKGLAVTSLEEMIEARQPTRSMRYEFVLTRPEKREKKK